MKCFYSVYSNAAQAKKARKQESKHQFETMSSTKEQLYPQSQEQPHFENDFEMVKVSIGFVRSLQDSVLRLERNQQHLIAQLDHANSLATEYHETSRMYHQKYDEVLHKMEELKRKHEHEIAILFDKIEEANRETENERAIRQIHAEQIELLERQIAQQMNYASISQARTTVHIDNEDEDNEDYDNYYNNREVLSPVSVASLSPRSPRYGYESPRLDPETPDVDNSEDEEGEDEEESDNDTEREFQMRYYHESLSSQTTDCSGDPICHSDRDDSD